MHNENKLLAVRVYFEVGQIEQARTELANINPETITNPALKLETLKIPPLFEWWFTQ